MVFGSVSRLVSANALVIKNLRNVMLQNTKHYKSDFSYDVKDIVRFAKNGMDFCWMSRDCGTHMFISELIEKRNYPRCYTFTHYRESESEHPVVYEVTNLRFDRFNRVIGDIYEVNYAKACDMIGEVK